MEREEIKHACVLESLLTTWDGRNPTLMAGVWNLGGQDSLLVRLGIMTWH